MNRIAVLTSGREVAGMNAAIRAIVRKGIFNHIDVYGIRNGFTGLMQSELSAMTLGSVGDTLHRGGTMLQSTLFPGFEDEDSLQQALTVLNNNHVDGLVVIGDKDAMKAANQLSQKGFPVIVIPASAENDIAQTDYCIGFDTAINTVIEAIDKIRDTASSHERTYVVEVLGLNSDDIPLWSGLCAGAESIVLPGSEDNMDDILERISQGYQRGKTHSIIVVSEGFSRKGEIAEMIQRETGYETKMAVLGHLQRGGSPSAYDRMISSRMGSMSIDLLMDQQAGLLISLKKSELTVVSIEDNMDQKNVSDTSIYHLARTLSI